ILVGLLFSALAAAVVGDPLLAVQFAGGAFLAAGFMTGFFSLLVAGLARIGPPRGPGAREAVRRALALTMVLVLLLLTILAAVRFPALAAILGVATLLWAAVTLIPPGPLFPLLIALRSLGRRRARTAVTLVAFLVGVLGMSLTLTVAFSLQRQITDALAATRAQNMVAIADDATRTAVLRASARLPGIRDRRAVTTATTLPLAADGRPLSAILGPAPATGGQDEGPADLLRGVTGYNLRSGARPASITIAAGRPLSSHDTGTANVLLNASLQYSPFSLHPGSHIRLRGSGTGTIDTATVVGFYWLHRFQRRGFASFFTPPIFADRSLALALAGANAQSVVSFTVAPADLTADATALQRAVPNALILNINDLTAVLQQILGDLLSVLVVITALALGAGLAVVGNGVTLAMLERYREIAIYKAVGFGPGDVLRFVLIENALIGVVAGAVSVFLVAVALAGLSHFVLQTAIGFDPLLAVLVLVGASTLAVLVAYLSARTPVGIRPIEALRNE
ncbi:MAG: FtsX-like permease family protein, partial [Chloroflexota bacterium]|nr:FtsX-like permease family protein [Chloroflexota bacterium]